jgi:hypothetical protein
MQGEKHRVHISVVIVCAVFTILMALLAMAGIWAAYEISAHGKIASARVVEKRTGGKSTSVIVDFTTTSGKHVRAKLQGVDEKPGTVIKVKYLPDNPTSEVEKVGSHSTAWWTAGPAFMAIVSAVLTVGLATGRLTVEDNRLVRARKRRPDPYWQDGTGQFE